MEVVFGVAILLGVLWVLWQAPATKSLAEEKRELLEHFRRKDREERR